MKFLFVVSCLLNAHILMSQEETSPIQVNISPKISAKDAITIDNLKFYLTNFSLVKSGETVWKETNSYHLIDISKPSSLSFNLATKIDFDEIHFSLGTDSLTNISGAMGGDLDPTKGMYWAWNSGYINFKLEGKSKSTSLEFHLGGYAPPYQTVQKIKLKTTKNDLTIFLNVSEFLNQIDLTKQHKIMSPGKEAQRLSKILSTLFYVNE